MKAYEDEEEYVKCVVLRKY